MKQIRLLPLLLAMLMLFGSVKAIPYNFYSDGDSVTEVVKGSLISDAVAVIQHTCSSQLKMPEQQNSTFYGFSIQNTNRLTSPLQFVGNRYIRICGDILPGLNLSKILFPFHFFW